MARRPGPGFIFSGASDRFKDMKKNQAPGVLRVVATPIGNLEDITARALRTLKESDYILCEDTRVTGKLLQHYGIVTRRKSYHAHSSPHDHRVIISDLEAGLSLALTVDAGTPGVSDPGVRLISLAHQSGLRVETIPGPSALTAAVAIVGFSGNQFTFLGFAPNKKGRQTFFKTILSYPHPVIFFESTHRIMKTLESLAGLAGVSRLWLCRELTKQYEEVLSGTPKELQAELMANPKKQKGEFVVIVENQKS